MADWILVPCLVSLRNEFNRLAPGRDKASDGSIGDSAHAGSSSDHNPDETGATPYEDADSRNEVHAIDVDADLRRSGWSMQKAVEVIVTRHRTGRDDRLQNVIYNRRIWSRTYDWANRPYNGSNPHDKHAHFSARYTTAAESDTSPWGLLEEDDMLTADDKPIIEAALKSVLLDDDSAVAGKLKARPWQYAGGGTPGDITGANLLGYFTALYANVKSLQQSVAALAGAVAGITDVDEQALAAALTPALTDAVREAGGGASAEEVEAALRNVLRAGVGS